MYGITLSFVILCVLPGSIWSQAVTPGLNSWCQVGLNDPMYPQPPSVCCAAAYVCDVYVAPHSFAYGVNNAGPRTLSLCSCDSKFGDCLLNNLPRPAAFKVSFLFRQETCMIPKSCSPGSDCNSNYEVMNFGTWVLQQNQDEDD